MPLDLRTTARLIFFFLARSPFEMKRCGLTSSTLAQSSGQCSPYYRRHVVQMKGSEDLWQVLTLDGWCDDIVRHVVYRQPVMGVPA